MNMGRVDLRRTANICPDLGWQEPRTAYAITDTKFVIVRHES